MLAPLLVPTCSQLENGPIGGPHQCWALLKAAGLFLLQSPCLLETHCLFLFASRTNQPITATVSPDVTQM